LKTLDPPPQGGRKKYNSSITIQSNYIETTRTKEEHHSRRQLELPSGQSGGEADDERAANDPSIFSMTKLVAIDAINDNDSSLT
jgi:hypothetical protein